MKHAPSKQDEAFKILNACPFGIFQGRLITPRHMDEGAIVEWVAQIYAWKERHARDE